MVVLRWQDLNFSLLRHLRDEPAVFQFTFTWLSGIMQWNHVKYLISIKCSSIATDLMPANREDTPLFGLPIPFSRGVFP